MDPWQPLLDNLAKLKASWPSPPWTWDGRFNTIASSFTIDREPEARASAMLVLPQGYTSKSIDTAPPELRALAERAGLRSNQRLLAGDHGVFGLWWPWGGGDKITLRIGIADLAAGSEPLPRVRELFDVKV